MSDTFYEFSSVETFIYVHGAVGQQLLVEDIDAQVKDLIALVELSLLPFSFIFEIQQGVQVILIVSLVSSGMESKREWLTQGFKKRGILVLFSTQFCRILSEGTTKFILCLFN